MSTALTGATSRDNSARRLSRTELKLARQAFSDPARGLVRLADDLGLANDLEALQAIGQSLNLKLVDLAEQSVDMSLLKGFPLRLIHRHSVFPIERTDDEVTLVISNPFDVQGPDAVAAATGLYVNPVLALPHEVATLIKSHLGVGAETLDGLMAQVEEPADGLEVIGELEFDESEAAAMAQQASVVRLVNDILVEAVKSRTSDIHMEVQESGIKIRYRIDGVLQTQPVPQELNRFQAAIISRLKIMAHLNIAEKRIPQDGRIKIRVSGREVDIRVSIIPMLHGESVVMRVLDKDALSFSLAGIGMEDDVNEQFQRLIRMPHGIVLVTGPTGSGKTTTLYSAWRKFVRNETRSSPPRIQLSISSKASTRFR
ncbi:MAG: ATPase, T2SS/T4P/T4SS family [Planctomycetaceae bacterium]